MKTINTQATLTCPYCSKQQKTEMGGGGNPMMGGWGSFGLLGGLSMLLLWILLLLGVVALVRYVGSSKRGNGDHY